MTHYFTLAANDRSEGPATLIFENTGEAPATQLERVIQDTSLQTLFPAGFTVIYDSSLDCVVAANDLDESVVSELSEAPCEHKGVFVWTPGAGGVVYDPSNVYYDCMLPQKLVLGCVRCIQDALSSQREQTEPTPQKHLCSLAQVYITNWCTDGISAGTMQDVLKNRKTQVGGWTYISPRLTASASFAKSLRPAHDHDFLEIKRRSEHVKQGLAERNRRSTFKKTVCPKCICNPHCNKVSTYYSKRYTRKWDWHQISCKGVYPKNEKACTVAMYKNLKGTQWRKWSPELLARIAVNSGTTNMRYSRRIAVLGMSPDGSVVLRSKVNNNVLWRSKDAAEVSDVLSTYTSNLSATALTKGQVCLLAACHQIRWSPTRNSGWHSTQYAFKYVEYSSGYSVFRLMFHHKSRWNNCLPWDCRICSVVDLYELFNTIPLCPQT